MASVKTWPWAAVVGEEASRDMASYDVLAVDVGDRPHLYHRQLAGQFREAVPRRTTVGSVAFAV